LNCFPETAHLVRIICNHFVHDDECFNLVAHWDRATRDGIRHRAVGGYDHLDTICVRVQQVCVQSEINVRLVQVKLEERVDKRDEVLLHSIIDFEMMILDFCDEIFDHFYNIRAKSHLINILTLILLS